MTGEEFDKLTKTNPSWCLSIKEPLEITTYANLSRSPITHLSPLITFSGRNMHGWVGSFQQSNLKVATGTFKGYVYFDGSAVEKIENLIVDSPCHSLSAASFAECRKLKVATGIFHGRVDFNSSGVEKIENLITTTKHGTFLGCPIKYVPKEYRGDKFYFSENIKENSIKIDIRTDQIKKIRAEANNIEL